MRLSTAVNFIILAHASCYVPSVLCKKGIMGDDIATERKLASSSSEGYNFRRNYVAIIEPKNFVTLFPNGGANTAVGLADLLGSSTIQNGKIYDPADIAIVNKLNGVEANDITDELVTFFGSEMDALDAIGGFSFAGGRQPKQPIPPGDSAFFYHGECVATSTINSPPPLPSKPLPSKPIQRQLGEPPSAPSPAFLAELNLFLASFTVTSHTCNLNICLGGGGFNCIAFYSGTSFVFNVGQQISRSNPSNFNGEISLPPPFPSTIIGGTGSFEGIEGTVDIATICGTTGPIIDVDVGKKTTGKNTTRHLEAKGSDKMGPVFNQNMLGLIVQTISINSNMPLPVAP